MGAEGGGEGEHGEDDAAQRPHVRLHPTPRPIRAPAPNRRASRRVRASLRGGRRGAWATAQGTELLCAAFVSKPPQTEADQRVRPARVSQPCAFVRSGTTAHCISKTAQEALQRVFALFERESLQMLPNGENIQLLFLGRGEAIGQGRFALCAREGASFTPRAEADCGTARAAIGSTRRR